MTERLLDVEQLVKGKLARETENRPLLLCLPYIPDDLVWNQNRVTTGGSRQLIPLNYGTDIIVTSCNLYMLYTSIYNRDRKPRLRQ
jgi:hypothetical protein